VNWKWDAWHLWVPTGVGLVALFCQLYLKRYRTALGCLVFTLVVGGLAYMDTYNKEADSAFDRTLEAQENAAPRENPLLSKSEALEIVARDCTRGCPENGMSDAGCARYCGCIGSRLRNIKDVLHMAELRRLESVAIQLCIEDELKHQK